MIKVLLLSTLQDPDEDTHWASPYYALKRAFSARTSSQWQLVTDPEQADLILICPRARNPVLPWEIFRGGVAWKYRRKCVVVSTDDNPTVTHKGFYTSLRAGTRRSPWIKGGFYPHVAYAQPEQPFPLDANFRYLFSFLGSFDTHVVRRQIGNLASTEWKAMDSRFLVRDTSGDNRLAQASQAAADAFRSGYLESLRNSKFILCPRGMCPSSVRLFEALKAGRVPVAISEEWVPPPDVPWHRFAVFIGEQDVASIPRILAQEESGFLQRAQAAQQAWNDYFSSEALPGTLTRWGMLLLGQTRQDAQLPTHVADLCGQVFRWRFIRRGVLSQLRQVLHDAGRE